MRSLKTLFVIAALGISTSSLAYPTYGIGNARCKELCRLLSKSEFPLKNDIKVIVRSSLLDRREILVHSKRSENNESNKIFGPKLQRQKLKENNWSAARLYEVPVVVRIRP